ncbi:MAG: hypothetical protein HOP13_05395 [Alphaproteobacteria bacterium]|nr:hypothetical protein [Alphaproteobacteria bacterium]
MKANQEQFDIFAFDATWNRRPTTPTLHSDLCQSDRSAASQDCLTLTSSVREISSRYSFCVNALGAQILANNKVIQLAAAAEVGLPMPATLISNDAQEIREFANRFGGQVIAKALTPASWAGEGIQFHTYSKRIRPEDMEASSIESAPAIFQQYIEKAFELRVTIMGDTFITAVLHSQSTDYGRDDWRLDQAGLKVTQGELPGALQNKLTQLMRKLGLVYGAADLIVTPAGEFVFLEVNEAGQFLWVERFCPEIPMLDCFTQFLLSRNPRFRYEEPAAPLRVRDYRAAEATFLKRFSAEELSRAYSANRPSLEPDKDGAAMRSVE